MTDISFAEKLKIDITVLITSIHQREIAIQTANYYSKICSEVIFVDEQQPYLTPTEVSVLKENNINYITYKNDSNNYVYQKRLIGASRSNKKFIVHSNHDERYTYHGLLGCVEELEKDQKLSFCIGQAIAMRKDNSEVHYTRSYKKLHDYQNIKKVEERLYYHAKNYAPLAHYAVWKRENYIKATEKTIFIHKEISTNTILDEIVFELAADLTGNSKAIPILFWIRNRVNPPFNQGLETKNYVFQIIKKKLYKLFSDLDNNVEVDILIESYWSNIPFFWPKSFIDKSIIIIKQKIRQLIKKKKIKDIDTLLNDSNVTFEKKDLLYALDSINLK
tara:strand:- start:190 stop:1188 length:999 start_codon:yes stop_codon:yes gene_type:complete